MRKIVFLALFVMLFSSCRSRSSNSELTAEQRNVNRLNAQLDYASSISKYAETVTALGKTVYSIRESLKDGEGLGLVANGKQGSFVSNNNRMALEQRMKEAEIQAVNTQNYATALNAQAQAAKAAGDNNAKIFTAQNEKSKIAAQNQKTLQESAGIAVDNIGKAIDNEGNAIENVGKALDNEIKSLEVVLKALYVNAYRLYVNIYGSYTVQLGKIWRQIGKAASTFGTVQSLFRRYHRQSLICESRFKRSLSDLNKIAAVERLDKIITYKNLPERLGNFASSSRGESCLVRAALSEQSITGSEELYHIDYHVDYGKEEAPVGISCPELQMTKVVGDENIEHDSLMVGDTILDHQVTLAEWPPAKYDADSGDLLGYYAPVTYLQVFTMFVTQGANIQINPPPADQSYDVCPHNLRRNRKMRPLFVKYVKASNDLEKGFFDRQVEVEVPTVVGSKKNGYNINKSKNDHYNKFLNKFTTIFAKADSCVSQAAPPPVEVGGERALGGAVASTIFNIYNESYSPLMSEALRQCWELGEQFRKRAKDQIEMSKELYEVMEKAAKISPPRAPHPTQFNPGPPQTSNGNNF